MTWGEYIELSLKRFDTINSKHVMLHLNNHPDREWTPWELKRELGLDIDENVVQTLLHVINMADLIRKNDSDNRYRGLTDGTLRLILRQRFEEEIAISRPDIPRTDLKQGFREEIRRMKKETQSLPIPNPCR